MAERERERERERLCLSIRRSILWSVGPIRHAWVENSKKSVYMKLQLLLCLYVWGCVSARQGWLRGVSRGVGCPCSPVRNDIIPVKVLLSQKQSALKFKRRHLKQFQLRHQLGLEKFFNLLMNIIKIKIGNAKIFVF